MKKIIIILLLLGNVYGSGLEFLNHEVGARENSLAGIGDMGKNTVFAAFYNPALIKVNHQFRLGASNALWLNEIDNYYGAIQFPWRDWNVEVSAYFSVADDIEVRNLPSLGPISTTTWTDWYIGFAVSRQIKKNIRVGVRYKRIIERIFDDSSAGNAFDLGIQALINHHMGMGISLKNIGKMNQLNEAASEMPLLFQTGWYYNDLVKKESYSIHTGLSYQHYSRQSLTHNYFRLAGEMTVKKYFFLRGGLIFGNDLSKYTFGLGVKQGIWNLNYALRPSQYGLDDIHVFSFSLSL